MQDVNGDGLPNDEWYELKGSEYGKPETIQDYAVTYFRPGPKMCIRDSGYINIVYSIVSRSVQSVCA